MATELARVGGLGDSGHLRTRDRYQTKAEIDGTSLGKKMETEGTRGERAASNGGNGVPAKVVDAL